MKTIRFHLLTLTLLLLVVGKFGKILAFLPSKEFWAKNGNKEYQKTPVSLLCKYESSMSTETSTVIVVSGPKLGGRTLLVRALAEGKRMKRDIAKFAKYLTTEQDVATAYPDRYQFITSLELTKLRNEGKLIFEGYEKGFFGSKLQIALSADEFMTVSSNPTSAMATSTSTTTRSINSVNGKSIEISTVQTYTKDSPYVIDGSTEVVAALSR